jgi:hypothetical protein
MMKFILLSQQGRWHTVVLHELGDYPTAQALPRVHSWDVLKMVLVWPAGLSAYFGFLMAWNIMDTPWYLLLLTCLCAMLMTGAQVWGIYSRGRHEGAQWAFQNYDGRKNKAIDDGDEVAVVLTIGRKTLRELGGSDTQDPSVNVPTHGVC